MDAICFGEIESLIDLGAHDWANLNFYVNYGPKKDENEVVTPEMFTSGLNVTPLMIAVSIGDIEVVKVLLMNKNIDVNAQDSNSGVNAIWLACLYEQG